MFCRLLLGCDIAKLSAGVSRKSFFLIDRLEAVRNMSHEYRNHNTSNEVITQHTEALSSATRAG